MPLTEGLSLHKELGKEKTRGRSEALHPQPMNQKLKYEESSLRVTGNPIGNEMQEKEQRMLDRENGKRR